MPIGCPLKLQTRLAHEHTTTAYRHTAGRYLQAMGLAKGRPSAAEAFAQSQGHWTDRHAICEAIRMAAVTSHDSGDMTATYNTSLVAESFLSVMRDFSIRCGWRCAWCRRELAFT